VDKRLYSKYTSYKAAVELKRGPARVNVRRRFHGTARACRLGDGPQHNRLCSGADCSMCGIIRVRV
jgi:hypothetical protein